MDSSSLSEAKRGETSTQDSSTPATQTKEEPSLPPSSSVSASEEAPLNTTPAPIEGSAAKASTSTSTSTSSGVDLSAMSLYQMMVSAYQQALIATFQQPMVMQGTPAGEDTSFYSLFANMDASTSALYMQQMTQMMQNPVYMQQMAQMMQLSANPLYMQQMTQMMQNPAYMQQMSQMASNPLYMQQMTQMMQNPAYMQQMTQLASMTSAQKSPFSIPTVPPHGAEEFTEDPIDECKLFVGGLPNEVDETVLRSYFQYFGPVRSVEVIRNRETGVSRGFGFVVFLSKIVGLFVTCNG